MSRDRGRNAGKGGLELIEEAVHLLRIAPAATLAIYYLGAIPFVLGFLYFWAEMSRSPFADRHMAEAALLMTALFLGMKFCQALFARRVRAQLAAEPMPRWSIRQSIRVFLLQATIQPTGFFLIPLALILALPFGWIYAFYQNVTALADGDTVEPSRLIKSAWKQASLWVWQNHLLLAIVLAFASCVFLNWAVVCFSVPDLLKMLFGIESMFTQSPIAMLNTTFFMAMFALTYLCVDPIVKAVYSLRCFHGESQQSGEDLKADLKRFAASPQPRAAMLLTLIMLACGSATAAVQSTPAISPTDLDGQIDDVIRSRKYAWRMPRETIAQADSEKGVITRFIEQIGTLAKEAVRTVMDWADEWLRRLFTSGRTDRNSGSLLGAILSSHVLLYVLLAVAISSLAIFLLRIWRGPARPSTTVTAEAVQPAPDVADEGVGADELPEDGWTKLARELLERGELRLAMRAFYFSSLAHLAQRNLIGIARFKSNREYEDELRRRGHALPNLLRAFGENLSVLEGIWYGRHEVNHELVDRFAANVETIKAAA